MPSIAGEVLEMTGAVSAATAVTGSIRTLLDNGAIYDGDTIQTSAGASVILQMSSGSRLSLGENTSLELSADVLNAVNVALTATHQITEDDSTISYTASLINPASGDVTITLDNGLVLTILDGQNSATEEFSVTSDSDVYIEQDQTIEAAVQNVSGGFGTIQLSTEASTNVVDSLDTTNISLTGDQSVVEGATATYTITLDNPPSTEMQVEVQTNHISTDNGDLEASTTLVTIPAGATTASFTIDNVLNTADIEGEED